MTSDLLSLVEVIRKGYSRSDLANVYEMMGLNYPKWLYILCQNALYSTLVGPVLSIDPTNVVTMPDMDTTGYDNDLLYLSQAGAPGVASTITAPASWPYDPAISVYKSTGSTAHVEYGGKSWTVGYLISNGLIEIDWPAELAIIGTIKLDGDTWDKSRVFHFASPANYPADVVAALLKKSGDAFAICEQVDAAAELVHAVDTQETLAIMIYALYKLLA